VETLFEFNGTILLTVNHCYILKAVWSSCDI